MSGLTTLSFLLIMPAAPLPGATGPALPALDRNQALLFAGRVVQIAYQINEQYVRPVEVKDLLEAALRGLYEQAGIACPDDVLATVRRAHSSSELSESLAEARMALGNRESLKGPKALYAAVNGFRHATDPNTGLVSPKVTSYVSIEMDFGIGMELEGTSGPRWTLYQVELGYATGRFPHDPAIGTVERPLPPVAWPWRVRRVIAGSPAQKAGLRPGDVVTHLDGKEITATSSTPLFNELVNGQFLIDVNTNTQKFPSRKLIVRREGVAERITLTVKGDPYIPETVFGARRSSEEGWDYMLDRDRGIGYMRIGAIETATAEKVSEVLAILSRNNCQGLILDMRWSPGGFVDPGVRIAGLFLEEGSLITRMVDRSAVRGGLPPDNKSQTPPGWTKFADKPLVILVGPETSGGGEMIAAALQDHNRAVVIGQRTLGKGNVQRTFPSQIGDLQFKVSTGYSLRPNGKNRHRFPDSKPIDDWGVRPDIGFEVPMTADALAAIRKSAELHSLRPFGNRDALDFDDPNRDPYRLLAVQYLSKKLRPGTK